MSQCYLPRSLEELGDALARLTDKSVILAGGTDLVIRLRGERVQPDAVLSLSEVPQLHEITITSERAQIGAMVTMTELSHATEGLGDLQALADAAGGVGSPQIRNRGTVGGNVANASPAADMPPVLRLLNAQVNLMGPGGAVRSMPISDFLPPDGGTCLAMHEIITGFSIDRTALQGWKSAFQKLGHRSQVTISRIGFGLALRLNAQGIAEDARVIVGAIKPNPFRLEGAEDVLRGQRPDPALAVAIGETFKGNTRRVYKENAAKGVAEDVLLRFLARP